MKKFISPESWFSFEYPDTWCEFEDSEDCFLFYNPERWSGNFRISACKGEGAGFAHDCMMDELQRYPKSRRVTVGPWECVSSVECDTDEKGDKYISYIWVTGKRNVMIECTFTVAQGMGITEAESILKSIRIRSDEDEPWNEVIPVRVSEISQINTAYEWAVSSIKKMLTKDFTSCEADIGSIQKVIDSGKFRKEQYTVWESFGILFGVILENEIDGMQWVTVIDGNKEYLALRFADTALLIYPQNLIWDCIREGKPCKLKNEYKTICQAVQYALPADTQ